MPFAPSPFNVEIPVSRCETQARNTLNGNNAQLLKDYKTELANASTTAERCAELKTLIKNHAVIRIDSETPFAVASLVNSCLSGLVAETIAVRNNHLETQSKAEEHDARIVKAVTGQDVVVAKRLKPMGSKRSPLTVEEAREAINNSTNAHVRLLKSMASFTSFTPNERKAKPAANPTPAPAPAPAKQRPRDAEADAVYQAEYDRLIAAGVNEGFAKTTAKAAKSKYLKTKHASPADSVYKKAFDDATALGLDEVAAKERAAVARKAFIDDIRRTNAQTRAAAVKKAKEAGVVPVRAKPNTHRFHSFIKNLIAVVYQRSGDSFTNGTNFVNFLNQLAFDVINHSVNTARKFLGKTHTLTNSIYNTTVDAILGSFGATPEVVATYFATVDANRVLYEQDLKVGQSKRKEASAAKLSALSQEERDALAAERAEAKTKRDQKLAEKAQTLKAQQVERARVRIAKLTALVAQADAEPATATAATVTA
jgi:hypothetical protein